MNLPKVVLSEEQYKMLLEIVSPRAWALFYNILMHSKLNTPTNVAGDTYELTAFLKSVVEYPLFQDSLKRQVE